MRLEVTKRAELAVRALSVLATAPARLKSGDLAAELDTTTGFVAQVVGPLVKVGWVRSDPGPTGGYSLQPGAGPVSVLDVIEVVEGPLENGRCVALDRPCDPGRPCTLHKPWKAARSYLRDQLAAVPAVPHPVPGGSS